MATTLLEVGHEIANGIDSELIELLAIGCGDATQSFVKVAHQVSQDLQEVVLNDLPFNGQVGELSCERARDQLRVIHYEILDQETKTETGRSDSVFVLACAAQNGKQRLKEDGDELVEVFSI